MVSHLQGTEGACAHVPGANLLSEHGPLLLGGWPHSRPASLTIPIRTWLEGEVRAIGWGTASEAAALVHRGALVQPAQPATTHGHCSPAAMRSPECRCRLLQILEY